MPKRIIRSGFRFAKAAYGLRQTKGAKTLGKVWRGAETAAAAGSIAGFLGGSDARKISRIKKNPEYLRANTSKRTAMLSGLCEPKSKTGGVLKCYPNRKGKKNLK